MALAGGLRALDMRVSGKPADGVGASCEPPRPRPVQLVHDTHAEDPDPSAPEMMGGPPAGTQHEPSSSSSGGNAGVPPEASEAPHGSQAVASTALAGQVLEQERTPGKVEESAEHAMQGLYFAEEAARAAAQSLDELSESVSRLLEWKDKLLASKALPVTALIPATLACSSILRQREQHGAKLHGLLHQVSKMAPQALIRQREALSAQLAQANASIEELRAAEAEKSQGLRELKTELISSRWNGLVLGNRIKKEKHLLRLINQSLRVKNSKLERRLQTFAENVKMRSRAGGAVRLSHEQLRLLSPRTTSPVISEDEDDVRSRANRRRRHREGKTPVTASSASPSPRRGPMDGSGPSVVNDVDVNRSSTPREAAQAIVNAVASSVRDISYGHLVDRPTTPAYLAQKAAAQGRSIPTRPWLEQQRGTTAPAAPGQWESSPSPAVSSGPVANRQLHSRGDSRDGSCSSPRSYRPSHMGSYSGDGGQPLITVTEESWPEFFFDGAGTDPGCRGANPTWESMQPSEPGPQPQSRLDGDPCPMSPFVNAKQSGSRVSSRGGSRRSRGARYKASKHSAAELSECPGTVPFPPPAPACSRQSVGPWGPEAPVLDSARELPVPQAAEAGAAEEGEKSAAAGSDGHPTAQQPPARAQPLVPALNLDSVRPPEGVGSEEFPEPSATERFDIGLSSRPPTPSTVGPESPPRALPAALAADMAPAAAPAYRPKGFSTSRTSADSFVSQFDSEWIPRSALLDLKLKHSLQMRSVQRAFEERLQILNNYWRDQGMALLDRKVEERGTTPASFSRERTPSPDARRAGSPSRRPRQPLTARPSTTSSAPLGYEYRTLPGGYHSFIYPAQAKSIVGYREGRQELSNFNPKSHDAWMVVKPFPGQTGSPRGQLQSPAGGMSSASGTPLAQQPPHQPGEARRPRQQAASPRPSLGHSPRPSSTPSQDRAAAPMSGRPVISRGRGRPHSQSPMTSVVSSVRARAQP